MVAVNRHSQSQPLALLLHGPQAMSSPLSARLCVGVRDSLGGSLRTPSVSQGPWPILTSGSRAGQDGWPTHSRQRMDGVSMMPCEPRGFLAGPGRAPTLNLPKPSPWSSLLAKTQSLVFPYPRHLRQSHDLRAHPLSSALSPLPRGMSRGHRGRAGGTALSPLPRGSRRGSTADC